MEKKPTESAWHGSRASGRARSRRLIGGPAASLSKGSTGRKYGQTYYHICVVAMDVVGARLDQAGMHWRSGSADAVVALRAALLSSVAPDLRPHCAHVH